MIWFNVCGVVISILTCVATVPTGALLPNLMLMASSSALLLDMTVFSLTAAVGLVVLLNTIAAFGALVSSTVMTIRQFLGIIINAGVFGNFAAVGLQGWLGVGWVGSGACSLS